MSDLPQMNSYSLKSENLCGELSTSAEKKKKENTFLNNDYADLLQLTTEFYA